MLNSFNDRGQYDSVISVNTSSQNTSSDMDSDLEMGNYKLRQTSERKKYLIRD